MRDRALIVPGVNTDSGIAPADPTVGTPFRLSGKRGAPARGKR